jgi:hypothetical protein
MPEITCLGCGRNTNTTMCDWSSYDDFQPRRCWATYDLQNNLWIKGCGYDQLQDGDFEKMFADKYIGQPLVKSKEELLKSLKE